MALPRLRPFASMTLETLGSISLEWTIAVSLRIS